MVTNSILPWGRDREAREGETGPDDVAELDKKQWEWLESTLKEASRAKYTHIVSRGGHRPGRWVRTTHRYS